MPFEERRIPKLRDWVEGDYFDPKVDRLLVTTSAHDTLVVMRGPETKDDFSLVIDKQFMPKKLGQIPSQLKLYCSLPFKWNPEAFDWNIFLFDGESLPDGQLLDMEAIGTGWIRRITTNFVIRDITPVHLADIDPRQFNGIIDGVVLEEYRLTFADKAELFKELIQLE